MTGLVFRAFGQEGIADGAAVVKERLEDIPQGARIIDIVISTTATVIIEIEGINNINLTHTAGGTIQSGLPVGGDFIFRLNEYVALLPQGLQDILKVQGTVIFSFDNDSGFTIKYSGWVVYVIE